MKQQVTRDEAMKLIGKNIVAIKKDGTRVTGKLLKVSGNKLVLKRLNGKKYVQKRFCHWYCLICSLLPHCLMLMEVVPASVPDMDLDQNQALDMVRLRTGIWTWRTWWRIWTWSWIRPLWSRSTPTRIFLGHSIMFFPIRSSGLS